MRAKEFFHSILVGAGVLLLLDVTLFHSLLSLQKWRIRPFAYVPAHDENIQYNGRWLSSANRLSKDASFTGSNLGFAVYNTTTVSILLANIRTEDHTLDPLEAALKVSLVLIPDKKRPSRAGCVNLIHTVNETRKISYHDGAFSYLTLEHGLDPDAVHMFKVILATSGLPSTIQFRGIHLDQGAHLVHPSRVAAFAAQLADNGTHNGMTASKLSGNKYLQRKAVEVVGDISLLSGNHHSDIEPSSTRSWVEAWPLLLEQHFADISVSTLSLTAENCITKQCRGRSRRGAPRIQDIFFRAGRPGTQLYNQPWPFNSGNDIPSALILILGLADVETFLSSDRASKHKVLQFVDDFSRVYSSFIQTIRRTAYSPSTLADRQAIGRVITHKPVNTDESYLYNSSPSTIPIFLVLPPIPSVTLCSRSRQLKALLSHTAGKVLSELKWHIGDKHTFVVDTAGWLEDRDFQIHDAEKNSYSLTQSGHAKFAYHMSMHLCHYLQGENCPFDRHDEYTGNLWVPETESVGRVVEEMKVSKMKEMFGIE